MEYPFYPGTNVYFGRAEAAMALRQRLNETVDQLDALKKEHTERSECDESSFMLFAYSRSAILTMLSTIRILPELMSR